MPPSRRLSARGLAASAFAALTVACTGGSEPPTYQSPRGADRSIFRMTTEITTDGRRALRVESDSAFFRTGSDTVKLVGVRASMFASTGNAGVTIEADSGALESGTQRLTALGTVTARTRDGGLTVRTGQLVFDPSTNRLTSDSATVVERGGSTERGPCFEGDALLTEWSLCGGSP